MRAEPAKQQRSGAQLSRRQHSAYTLTPSLTLTLTHTHTLTLARTHTHTYTHTHSHTLDPTLARTHTQVLLLAVEWGEREIVQHLMLNPPGVTSDFATVVKAVVGKAERERAVGGCAAAVERTVATGGSAGGGAAGSDDVTELTLLLADALLRALRTKHASIVDLLLERDARPAYLDLMDLWTDSTVTKLHHFNFHASFTRPDAYRRAAAAVDAALAGRARRAARGADDGANRSGARRPSSTMVLNPAAHREPLAHSASAYFREVVPFIQMHCRLPPSLSLWAAPPTPPPALETRRWLVRDLFFWAVFAAQDEGHGDDLAHTLWRYTDQPIREALVASHMAARLAALSRRGPAEYERRARAYEGWYVPHCARLCARALAWRGAAWRAVARRGVAWRGVAWRGAAWRGVAWRGVAWRRPLCRRAPQPTRTGASAAVRCGG